MARALKNYKNGIYDEYLLPYLKRYFKAFGIKDGIKRFVSFPKRSKHMSFFMNFVLNRITSEERVYASSDDISLIMSEYWKYFEVPSDFRFELRYGFSFKEKSEFYTSGTVDEIFKRIKDHVAGKKVFLNFSSWGIYTGANIKYVGTYSEEVLKLIIKNAGWICYNIYKINEQI